MKSTARIGSHPIHPMLISFPLGLWVTSVIVDVLSARSVLDLRAGHIAAYYMALAGCIGAVLAAIPGVIDLLTVVPSDSPARRVGWTHGLLNIAALVLFAISVWSRGQPGVMTVTAYVTALVGLAVLAVSGWLGGSLVYDHKIGVPNESAR